LDVLYHLLEDEACEAFMRQLFGTPEPFVIVYSSNWDEPCANWSHIRHRRFTSWVENEAADRRLAEVVRNPYPWDRQDPDYTSLISTAKCRKWPTRRSVSRTGPL